MIKIKSDLYRKRRGGTTKLIEIVCNTCNSVILIYQKDGKGKLRRCYLNRIFEPPELERLQKEVSNKKDLSNLVCNSCGTLIGTPMVHTDGRLAYNLRYGSYYKKNWDNLNYKKKENGKRTYI